VARALSDNNKAGIRPEDANGLSHQMPVCDLLSGILQRGFYHVLRQCVCLNRSNSISWECILGISGVSV